MVCGARGSVRSAAVSSSRVIAEALADSVVRRGADRVFGIPGGGSNLDVIGACADRGVPFVLAHAETPAAIMAATYGFATGRPALVVATRGPGCAASVNGAAQATLDRFPLVICTDGVNATAIFRRGGFEPCPNTFGCEARVLTALEYLTD